MNDLQVGSESVGSLWAQTLRYPFLPALLPLPGRTVATSLHHLQFALADVIQLVQLDPVSRATPPLPAVTLVVVFRGVHRVPNPSSHLGVLE